MYVVITGGSRGIGKALAYKFASVGYDLILTCEKNIGMLIDVKNDIENKYDRKVFIKMGLLTEDDINDFEKKLENENKESLNKNNEKLLKTLSKIKDNIYILINNAGKCDYNLLSDVNDDRYKEITYSNLDYAFFTTKLISKYLVKNKQGIIINITSMWGLLGASCETIYSMTKAGLIGMTKAYAKELKNVGVDVIAFALGAVDTDMCKSMTSLYKDKETLDKGIAEFVKTLDNGRMFTAGEIADKIYEYISGKNYNTGDIIELNNGLK